MLCAMWCAMWRDVHCTHPFKFKFKIHNSKAFQTMNQTIYSCGFNVHFGVAAAALDKHSMLASTTFLLPPPCLPSSLPFHSSLSSPSPSSIPLPTHCFCHCLIAVFCTAQNDLDCFPIVPHSLYTIGCVGTCSAKDTQIALSSEMELHVQRDTCVTILL